MKAFSNVHPIILMVYFVSVLSITMFITNPLIELLALSGSIFFCVILTGRKERREDLKFYLPLLILITITNPLFSHNGQTPLFFMNGNAVTLEAIIYGVAIAVMVIAVMLWCKSYSHIMTSDKFVYLFGRVIPKLSLVLSMALRYIPMLKRQSLKVNRAQKAMGLYTSKSYVDRVCSVLRVFSVLVGWSLENAVETGKSMKARGYGLKGRTNYSNFKFKKSDGLLLGVNIALLFITVIGIISGELDFTYYPKISQLQFGVMAVISYISFAILAYLPFFIEVEEEIRWKFYRSKI
ncbi:MAG: energy-coupling factor transporter transmembrane component T [Acutalibacteraceae bacterium]|nr:energy-coupling factor transporter transmembrane component T [Acutalibacteraceae bacterium]